MTGDASSALYFGRVTHRRLKPVSHRLSYRVFAMLADLDEIDALAARLKLFSRNRFNLYSFHDRDFGEGDADLSAYVRALAARAGVDASGPLRLLFYPRILGYAFNPIAVFYLHDAGGLASAVLYEVRNTFGGKHSYLIPVCDPSKPVIRQQADKCFHVSPFMEMETRYHFRLTPPGDSLAVAIRQTDEEGAVLHAAFVGERRALSERSLREAFWRFPLMTVKVIAGIHLEAARLLLKGMRLRRGAPDPVHPVTLVGDDARGRPA